MAFSGVPSQPPSQRYNPSSSSFNPPHYEPALHIVPPYSSSYSLTGRTTFSSSTTQFSSSFKPSMPPISQPRSFTPPPNLPSSVSSPLQGRTSFPTPVAPMPTWASQSVSPHFTTFQVQGAPSLSFQPIEPSYQHHPTPPLSVPSYDFSRIPQPQFSGAVIPSFQLGSIAPTTSYHLSPVLPFRERWETSYMAASPLSFNVQMPTFAGSPFPQKQWPSFSFVSPGASLQAEQALHRHFEETLRNLHSINAHPEHLLPGWGRMGRPHLILNIDAKTTVFIDPHALNNFIQGATSQEKEAAKTQLLQLAVNSKAVQQLASSLGPAKKSDNAFSRALKDISSSLLSEITHEFYDIYARDQASRARMFEWTARAMNRLAGSQLVPIQRMSGQELGQQLAEGHAKIDDFFNTNQAYQYDPNYRPIIQMVIGELPFPGPGSAPALTRRVSPLIALERSVARTGAIAAEALESRALVAQEARGLLNRAQIEKVAYLEQRISERLFDKAEKFLKPYSKGFLPETRARELIHQTGVRTFPRPVELPENFRVRLSNGGAGMLYVHPEHTHISIRVMPGKPHSPNPNQQKPYVIYMKNGKALDKHGNIVNKKAPEAHISLEDFTYRD